MIRKMTFEDIPAIIDVNIKTWLSAYKGIMSDEVLEGRIKTRDQAVKRLEESYHKGVKILVAEVDGQVVGFSRYGKDREKDSLGEIYALYVLKAYQKFGLGRQLVTKSFEDLNSMGYSHINIWVLKENPSRFFYEKMGGMLTDDKIITIGGQDLEEVCYRFER